MEKLVDLNKGKKTYQLGKHTYQDTTKPQLSQCEELAATSRLRISAKPIFKASYIKRFSGLECFL